MNKELHVYKYSIEGDLNNTYCPLYNIKGEDGTLTYFTVKKKLN